MPADRSFYITTPIFYPSDVPHIGHGYTEVAAFIQRLYDTGFIEPGDYEGFYCVGCEEFKQTADLVTGTGRYDGELVCAIHSIPVELLKERNYFFRMSRFTDALLRLYEERPDFVQPDSARNEVVQFVKQGLDDLSISRSTFDWGVPVPWDPKHVVYVWFDALLNYVTAVGYDADPATLAKRWPAIHLVGKDILRFHAVIWPAMLLAAGLEVPHQIFAHGWLLVGGEKMSKSKLTGIAPNRITDVFGSDAFRYYFMRAIPFGQDGSFSWEDLAARYQAELANGFGNLASRTIAMIGRYRDGAVPAAGAPSERDLVIRTTVRTAAEQADAAIDRMAPHEAIGAIWRIVEELNGYITLEEPWALAKDPAQSDRLDSVLATAAEGLRALAVLLSPVLPVATARLWAALGAQAALGDLLDQPLRDAGQWGLLPPGTRTAALEPLFPRIDQAVLDA